MKAILAKAKVAPDQLAAVVISGRSRAHAGRGEGVRIDAKKQLADTLWAVVGDAARAAALMLSAALERASRRSDPRHRIGDGADAILLARDRSGGALPPQVGVGAQIELKRTLRRTASFCAPAAW